MDDYRYDSSKEDRGVMFSELGGDEQNEVRSMAHLGYVIVLRPGGGVYDCHVYENGIHSTPFFETWGFLVSDIETEMKKRYPNSYRIPNSRIGF